MRSRFSFKSALVGGLFVALLLSAVPVGAAVGDVIRAGRSTTANRSTNLKGPALFQNLKITNTRAVGVAAKFIVEPGNPPFRVNSGVIVPALNADRIDGVHAAGLLKKKDYDPDRDGSVVSADTVEGVALDNLLPGGVLPAGATIRGTYAVGGSQGNWALHGVDFGYTLSQEPTVHYVSGGTPPDECPGSASSPEAAPGHLCIFQTVGLGVTPGAIEVVRAQGGTDAANPFGFFLAVRPADATGTEVLVYGGWAVTAHTVGAAPAPGANTSDPILGQ